MYKAHSIAKIKEAINLLAEYQDENKNENWNELPKNLKEHFNDENTYNIILKLKEFVDNNISIKKQELENKNIVYSLLLYNFKIYESLLREFGLLTNNDSLDNIAGKLEI